MPDIRSMARGQLADVMGAGYRADELTRADEFRNAYEGGYSMRAHWMLALLVAAAISAGLAESAHAQSPGGYTPPAYGQSWGQYHAPQDWERFYHYPYVYYPQNYYGAEYFKSSNNPYFRYPQEMRTPVYNKKWHNFYPSERLYHSGHHFNLDVF